MAAGPPVGNEGPYNCSDAGCAGARIPRMRPEASRVIWLIHLLSAHPLDAARRRLARTPSSEQKITRRPGGGDLSMPRVSEATTLPDIARFMVNAESYVVQVDSAVGEVLG